MSYYAIIIVKYIIGRKIAMELLKERIQQDGIIKEGNVLKVDSFLNHQMDINLFNEMGKEFKRLFAGHNINKALSQQMVDF